jgi:hypothetical protein
MGVGVGWDRVGRGGRGAGGCGRVRVGVHLQKSREGGAECVCGCVRMCGLGSGWLVWASVGGRAPPEEQDVGGCQEVGKAPADDEGVVREQRAGAAGGV